MFYISKQTNIKHSKNYVKMLFMQKINVYIIKNNVSLKSMYAVTVENIDFG